MRAAMSEQSVVLRDIQSSDPVHMLQQHLVLRHPQRPINEQSSLIERVA